MDAAKKKQNLLDSLRDRDISFEAAKENAAYFAAFPKLLPAMYKILVPCFESGTYNELNSFHSNKYMAEQECAIGDIKISRCHLATFKRHKLQLKEDGHIYLLVRNRSQPHAEEDITYGVTKDGTTRGMQTSIMIPDFFYSLFSSAEEWFKTVRSVQHFFGPELRPAVQQIHQHQIRSSQFIKHRNYKVVLNFSA